VLFGVAFLAARPSTGQATLERTAQPAATTPITSDSVVVTDAWARPALKGGTGGVYMTIANKSHSVIRIVSATSALAPATELHVSTVHDGMAHMEMLRQLVITPGASVFLKPGGSHFMLVGLRKALVKGDTTRLTLRLQTGELVLVNVAVRTQ